MMDRNLVCGSVVLPSAVDESSEVREERNDDVDAEGVSLYRYSVAGCTRRSKACEESGGGITRKLEEEL